MFYNNRKRIHGRFLISDNMLTLRMLLGISGADQNADLIKPIRILNQHLAGGRRICRTLALPGALSNAAGGRASLGAPLLSTLIAVYHPAVEKPFMQ